MQRVVEDSTGNCSSDRFTKNLDILFIEPLFCKYIDSILSVKYFNSGKWKLENEYLLFCLIEEIHYILIHMRYLSFILYVCLICLLFTWNIQVYLFPKIIFCNSYCNAQQILYWPSYNDIGSRSAAGWWWKSCGEDLGSSVESVSWVRTCPWVWLATGVWEESQCENSVLSAFFFFSLLFSFSLFYLPGENE